MLSPPPLLSARKVVLTRFVGPLGHYAHVQRVELSEVAHPEEKHVIDMCILGADDFVRVGDQFVLSASLTEDTQPDDSSIVVMHGLVYKAATGGPVNISCGGLLVCLWWKRQQQEGTIQTPANEGDSVSIRIKKCK